MKKLLLTTVAVIAISTPAMAGESQGWFDTMKESVQTWFAGEQQSTPEVEAYLDEVTIAVPPMTGEEAAAIMPAAGDYVEDVQDTLEQAPAAVAPGSIEYETLDESSFNTEFTGTDGSVAALEDTMSADDFANIMPAAGDAEEITDEAVVVAEEAATTAQEAVETAEEASEIAEEAQEIAEEASDMQEEANEMAAEAETMMDEAEEMAKEATQAVETETTAMDDMAPAAGEAMDTAKDMME